MRESPAGELPALPTPIFNKGLSGKCFGRRHPVHYQAVFLHMVCTWVKSLWGTHCYPRQERFLVLVLLNREKVELTWDVAVR